MIRKTPKNLIITDFVLVNKEGGVVTAHIPCIAWNANFTRKKPLRLGSTLTQNIITACQDQRKRGGYMETKQEHIKKMARSMCGYCSTDGKCAVSKNGREPDICANVDTEHCLYKEYSERLIESGYGDVSEYKAEIERLEEIRNETKSIDNSEK